MIVTQKRWDLGHFWIFSGFGGHKIWPYFRPIKTKKLPQKPEKFLKIRPHVREFFVSHELKTYQKIIFFLKSFKNQSFEPQNVVVFFCVIWAFFAIFGCVIACVMCNDFTDGLCNQMSVITWHAITVVALGFSTKGCLEQ